MKNNLLVILMILTVLLFTSCESSQTADDQIETTQSKVSDEVDADIFQPSKENQSIQKYFSTNFSDNLEESGITADEICNDLSKRTDLIPRPPVLGGTFDYFDIVVLNSSMVFAYAEDGHIGCEMIFGYEIRKQKIKWRLIAYNFNDEGLVVVD